MLSNCRNMASNNCMAINLIGEGDSSSRCCPIHITATGCWCLQRKKKMSKKIIYKKCLQRVCTNVCCPIYITAVATDYCCAISLLNAKNFFSTRIVYKNVYKNCLHELSTIIVYKNCLQDVNQKFF